MRKIILNVTMSLDGCMEGPNGEIDWCFTDQDYGMTDFLNSIYSIFYGRKSYELMIKMGDDYFADKQQYVFSRSLETVESPYQLLNGDWKKTVEDMRRAEGKDI